MGSPRRLLISKHIKGNATGGRKRRGCGVFAQIMNGNKINMLRKGGEKEEKTFGSIYKRERMSTISQNRKPTAFK